MSTIAERIVQAQPDNATSEVTLRGELSRAEIEELAETSAQQLLGVSSAEAFAMLDSGVLDGTLAEGTLRSLQWLLSE
jgi:hypothetical protein